MGKSNTGVGDDRKFSRCGHCGKSAYWVNEAMVYPLQSGAPEPNPDLPEDIARDYHEAKDILGRSPRGAAALLRLAVQKLCKHLGEPGKDINADVAALVRKGLLPQVQMALDGVRVVGNNAVHPGTIDLNDTPEVATVLFSLVNLIADQMITAPKQSAAVFALLPQGARDAIAKRDGKLT